MLFQQNVFSQIKDSVAIKTDTLKAKKDDKDKKKSSIKSFKEIITDKAVSDEGVFTVHKVEDKYLIVEKVLDIEKFPEEDTYETIAGFMMYMLKSIPKKAAKVEFENYTFEVVDVDNFAIDQLLVTQKQNQK